MHRPTDRADRGVSQVVGVVLIVAVVVTLASTAGYLVLDTTEAPGGTAPQVAVTTTYDERTGGDGQSLTVAFESGDALGTRNVSFVLADAVAVDPTTGSESPVELAGDPIRGQAGSRVTAGETVTVDATTVAHEATGAALAADEHLDLGDATLRLVWNPEDPAVDDTAVIWRWSPQ